MPNIMICRKESEVSDFPKKATKGERETILTELTAKLRVKRDNIVSFFLPTTKGRSEFARLATVTRSELHHLADCRRNGVMTPEAKATVKKGWIVPESDLGRAPKGGERDWESTAQSILIFCKDRIGAVSADHGVYTVDNGGTDISVVVID